MTNPSFEAPTEADIGCAHLVQHQHHIQLLSMGADQNPIHHSLQLKNVQKKNHQDETV